MALSKLSLNWRLFPVASQIQLHKKSAFRKWSKSFFANVNVVVFKQIQSDYFVLSFCCCFQTDSKWLFCFVNVAVVVAVFVVVSIQIQSDDFVVVSKQIRSDYFVLHSKLLLRLKKNWSNISSTYNLFFCIGWLLSVLNV